METFDPLSALALPQGALVDRRVPKSLLVDNGAPTAADRRRIREGIEELRWAAALKPTTIGVAEFRDGTREYLEIAVLNLILRSRGGCHQTCRTGPSSRTLPGNPRRYKWKHSGNFTGAQAMVSSRSRKNRNRRRNNRLR